MVQMPFDPMGGARRKWTETKDNVSEEQQSFITQCTDDKRSFGDGHCESASTALHEKGAANFNRCKDGNNHEMNSNYDQRALMRAVGVVCKDEKKHNDCACPPNNQYNLCPRNVNLDKGIRVQQKAVDDLCKSTSAKRFYDYSWSTSRDEKKRELRNEELASSLANERDIYPNESDKKGLKNLKAFSECVHSTSKEKDKDKSPSTTDKEVIEININSKNIQPAVFRNTKSESNSVFHCKHGKDNTERKNIPNSLHCTFPPSKHPKMAAVFNILPRITDADSTGHENKREKKSNCSQPLTRKVATNTETELMIKSSSVAQLCSPSSANSTEEKHVELQADDATGHESPWKEKQNTKETHKIEFFCSSNSEENLTTNNLNEKNKEKSCDHEQRNVIHHPKININIVSRNNFEDIDANGEPLSNTYSRSMEEKREFRDEVRSERKIVCGLTQNSKYLANHFKCKSQPIVSIVTRDTQGRESDAELCPRFSFLRSNSRSGSTQRLICFLRNKKITLRDHRDASRSFYRRFKSILYSSFNNTRQEEGEYNNKEASGRDNSWKQFNISANLFMWKRNQLHSTRRAQSQHPKKVNERTTNQSKTKNLCGSSKFRRMKCRKGNGKSKALRQAGKWHAKSNITGLKFNLRRRNTRFYNESDKSRDQKNSQSRMCEDEMQDNLDFLRTTKKRHCKHRKRMEFLKLMLRKERKAKKLTTYCISKRKNKIRRKKICACNTRKWKKAMKSKLENVSVIFELLFQKTANSGRRVRIIGIKGHEISCRAIVDFLRASVGMKYSKVIHQIIFCLARRGKKIKRKKLSTRKNRKQLCDDDGINTHCGRLKKKVQSCAVDRDSSCADESVLPHSSAGEDLKEKFSEHQVEDASGPQQILKGASLLRDEKKSKEPLKGEPTPMFEKRWNFCTNQENTEKSCDRDDILFSSRVVTSTSAMQNNFSGVITTVEQSSHTNPGFAEKKGESKDEVENFCSFSRKWIYHSFTCSQFDEPLIYSFLCTTRGTRKRSNEELCTKSIAHNSHLRNAQRLIRDITSTFIQIPEIQSINCKTSVAAVSSITYHKRQITYFIRAWKAEKRKNVHMHKKGQRLLDEGNVTKTHFGQIREEVEPLLGNPPLANNSYVCMQEVNNRLRSLQQCSELHDRAEVLASSGFFLNQNKSVECYSCSSRWTIDQAVSRPSWHSLHKVNCRYSSSHSVEQPRNIRQVASDTPAIISDDIGDPPGQQSVYIPSGDTRSETYRLSTFERFPNASSASIASLAKDGFYYTGYFDRVKCFACARSVERFEARDNVVKREWHKPNCPLAKGEPCGNIPKFGLFDHLFSNPAVRPGSSQQQENVLQQRDPVTGAVVRTVRYPADLPERVRRSGGVFEIGPNNSVVIQSGPGHQSNPPIRIGTESAPRQWRMANIISGDHRRFVLNLFLNRELDRLTSFARWPSTRPNISPAALARSGFFYLGDLDRTQCFSCGGVLRNWTLEDDADEEHRTHFPACPMILRTERRNIPIPELPESLQERQTNYPCLYPANPHMRSEANRLGTFDHRWPTGRIRATPAQIAEAGFFYLGERDRVKCWYCNGGLQNWERDDVPWDEHAKWFPNCQFVLQNKGQTFVFRHLALNPHLARPIIARQEGSPIGAQAGAPEPARSLDIPPSGTTLRQPEAPPVIVDPQVEMRKRNERIEEIMKNSEIVKMVLTMGFSDNLVKLVLEDKIGAENSSSNIYESVSTLLDDVMKKETELAQEEEHEEEDEQPGCSYPRPSNRGSFPSVFSSQTSGPVSTLGSAAGSGLFNVSMFQDEDEDMETGDLYSTSAQAREGPASAPAPGENPASLKKFLDQIEEERMCKVCFSNEADMVFIPCSHMCCCMECTQALRQCPVCRVKIEKAIKTYTK